MCDWSSDVCSSDLGNVTNAGTNELVIPNYKQTWGNIRKIADAPRAVRHLSFKSKEYRAG